MRLVRTVLAAVVAGVLGAAAGRLAVAMREEARGGEAAALDLGSLLPRPQEVVPGLVAALRVQDQPWAALHIPAWLAAFVVNFATVALGRELGPMLRSFGLGGETEPEPDSGPAGARSGIWTSEAYGAAASGSSPSSPSSAPERRADEAYPGFRPFAT